MMCAIVEFVPPDDAANIFGIFMDSIPEEFLPVVEYFEISH